MSKNRLETYLYVLVILLIGLGFRLMGLTWGEGQPIHPDEEFLRQVTAAVELPDRWDLYLDTDHSPLNPYNRGHGFFVYGTLPLFLTRATGEALDRGCRDGAAVSLPSRILAPILLGKGVACHPDAFIWAGARHLGRLLAALFDVGSILFVFLAGRRLRSDDLGLLAALLYALAVLPIQQSHFYTVDAFANFFVAATIYLALAIAQTGGWAAVALAGLATGLGMACKISVWPLAPLVAAAVGIWAFAHSPARSAAECRQSKAECRRALMGFIARGILAGALAFLAFRLAQPYAFTGPGFLDIRLNPQWLKNMAEVRSLMSGAVDTYPGHQWTNRLPLVFPWVNMVFWGLGLPLGLTAWAAWGIAGARLLRPLVVKRAAQQDAVGDPLVARHEAERSAVGEPPVVRHEAERSAVGKRIAALVANPLLLPWLWATGYFLYQGTQWVKSVRYLLPVYPAFVLLAAWLLYRVAFQPADTSPAPRPSETGASEPSGSPDPTVSPKPGGEILRRQRWTGIGRVAFFILVVGGTLLWALSFTSVYRRSHTRIAASRWIFQNIPVGSVLATEHWDWAPPLRVDGKDPFGGMYRGLSTSSDGTLQLYHNDTLEKRESLLKWLDEADYIIIGSNRLYASIVRLPTRYPLTIAYYRALFRGELGFELIADFTSYPALGPFQFPDTEEPFPVPQARYQYRAAPISVLLPPAEETFSVYDHPRVLIFRKTESYSRARAEAVLPPSLLDHVIWVTPKQETLRLWRRFFPFLDLFQGPSTGARRPLLDAQTWAEQRAGGTWSAMFDRASPLNRSSFLAAAFWYLTVAALGWLVFPLVWVALPRLTDRGYGLTRLLGLLLVSYLTWLGASLRILPNTRGTIALAVLLTGLAGAAVAWRRWGPLRDFLCRSRTLILVYEGLFLVLFGFWAWVRALNPDLWHPVVGGEKPMDFAYLNAVIKSTWFPPYNPWFAGGFINYYYFGFVLVGTLAKLTGIMPSVAYNLALALFYALTGGAAFCVAFNLTAGSPARSAAECRPAGSPARSEAECRPAGSPARSEAECRPAGSPARSATECRPAGSPARSEAECRPYVAGILAVLFLLVLGNLGEARLLFDGFRLVAGETSFQSTIPGLAALVQALKGFGMVLGGASLPFRPETPYWNPTRMIPVDSSGVGPITEFPAFTFLYADLHAHLLALPYTLCVLVLMLEWARGRAPSLLSLLWGGLVVGMLRAANTWDYPTYLLLGMAGIVLGPVLEAQTDFRGRDVARGLLWALVLAILTVLFFLPYIRTYIAPYNRVRLWTDARTPLGTYLHLVGQFLFPVGTLLLVEVWRTLQITPGRFAIVLIGLFLCGLVPALLGVPVAVVVIPCVVLAVGLVFGPVSTERRLWGMWVAGAVALTLGVEVLVLEGDIGRMNTVFKFYFQAWTLLAVGAAAALVWLADLIRNWPRDLRHLWWGVMGAMVFAMALFPAMSIPAKVKDRFTHATGPTLDGMAYIQYSRTGDVRGEVDLGPDYGGILWLLDNVQGSPVILEGLGVREYLWGSRISIYTGLPAVVGWRWHEVQQGMGEEVNQRHADVHECYDTPLAARALEILRRYDVRYVYVGPYERLYYDPTGLAKFDDLVVRGLLRLVYNREGVKIYEVLR